MSKTKKYYDEYLTYDYLSAEEFDLMFEDEYELWLESQKNKLNKSIKNDGHNIGSNDQ